MKSLNKKYQNILALMMISVMMFINASCSSSSSPAGTTPTTLGTATFAIELSSDNTVPQVSATATGTGTLTLDRDSGALSGSVTASGLTGAISAAHIHEGIAGIAGGIIVTLEADTSVANQMNVPSGTTLSAAQMTSMQASEYYINVHTAANGSGETRGQIVGANEQVIRVLLRGQNEVPAEVNTTNSGVGYVTVNTSSGDVRGNIRNTGLDNASAAHIHAAFAGVNGGIDVTLEKDTGDSALWHVPDATTLDASKLANMLAGGTYFNVHTAANTSGEVRGQIIPDNIELVRVNLSGDFENPPVTSAGNAVGYITVNETSLAVTAHVITDNLADTSASHIHTGFAGTNGGIVVGLVKDTTDPNLFSTAADASYADSTELADFEAGNHYFNVHTTTNSSGEVRGQIAPGNIKVTRNVLDGSQEVPPVTTALTGIGYTTVNESTGDINANLRTSDETTATAAHVHQAAAGSNGGIAVPLAKDTGDNAFWSAVGVLNSTQLDAFKADGLYFNVHSTANSGGEIRGQITR